MIHSPYLANKLDNNIPGNPKLSSCALILLMASITFLHAARLT